MFLNVWKITLVPNLYMTPFSKTTGYFCLICSDKLWMIFFSPCGRETCKKEFDTLQFHCSSMWHGRARSSLSVTRVLAGKHWFFCLLMTFLTEASMLTPQEVIAAGPYHLDSRGAERRWLPPTLPNCENGLSSKHYVSYSIAVWMCHVSPVLTLFSPCWPPLFTSSALRMENMCSFFSQF